MKPTKIHLSLLGAILVTASIAAPTAISEKFYEGAHEYTILSDGKTVSAKLRTDIGPTLYGEMYFPGTVTNNGKEYTVTEIGDYGYNSSYCNHVTSLTIPNTVTTIGKGAFKECTALKDLTIGNSVTTIGEEAFCKCTSLPSVTIPQSVKSIGQGAFFFCSNIEEFKVEPGNEKYDSRDDCNALIETATNILLYGTKNTVIPSSVSVIGSYAFAYCTSPETFTIPDWVTTIGDYAFSGCSNMRRMTLPSSVTSIGSHAFYANGLLSTFYMPNSVTMLGSGAFRNCPRLCNFTLSNSITAIGDSTFMNDGLTSLAIPNSVKSIGISAFYNCTSLKYLTLPGSMTTIGAHAFCNCKKMTDITLPLSIESISSNLFCGCSSLRHIIIPDAVTTIESSAFAHCTSLESVTIPCSVTSIGAYAFSNCTSLGSITLPCTVNAIGEKAFMSCTRLKSITIPSSATSIGNQAFSGCDSLAEATLIGVGNFALPPASSNFPSGRIKTLNVGSGITGLGDFNFNPTTVNCYATVPPSCSSTTFYSYDATLHVPMTATVAYFSAPFWKNFGNLSNDLTDKITLSQTTASLTQWDELQLTATVTPQGSALTWSTCDAGVATVDAAGKVRALAAGTCDIIVSLSDNPAVCSVCNVTVSYPEITLTLDKDDFTLGRTGEQVTLVATVTPGNTGLTPTWSTSSPEVATVDANGTVTAVGKGECIITASLLGKSAICHIKVAPAIVITVDITQATIQINELLTLTPSFSPEETDIAATSSKPSVAAVRVIKLSGVQCVQVVGVETGTATITISSADGDAVPATCHVTVVGDLTPGDVNGDGVVNGADVTTLYNVLLNGDEAVGDGDVNGDGIVNGADITALYTILLE